MAFTEYTGETTVIGDLGTNPSERGLTTQEFKDKFDQFAKEFVEWFNETHLPEVAEKAELEGLAGEDRTTETVKGNADALATHLAETMQDNVHGLGDRPMVSTGVKTYYIDGTNGSDSNDGLTTATAFKTWDKARKQIPILLTHPYEIRIIGNLNEIIDVPPTMMTVYFTIRGDTDTASNHKVNGIKIHGCIGGSGGGSVFVRYLESSGRIEVHGSVYVTVINCNPRNSGGIGVNIRGSSVNVSGCDFGTDVVQDAISAGGSSIVASYYNQGNATRYGLYSTTGAIICKANAQPTGTTANEHKVTGGQIFS